MALDKLHFTKPTLVTITAPTASGKNYLRDGIENAFDWNRIVSTTTRPMRNGEVEGEDYYFISAQRSLELEGVGALAELIEFRGVRYGVTHREMDRKMDMIDPPMVILEPKGLAIYKTMCNENGWDVFSIYVHTPEPERIRRLTQRTCADIQAIAVDSYEQADKSLLNRGNTFTKFEKVVNAHTDRILSITTEERLWSNQNNWDVIAPGDNLAKALEMIEQGVKWRNRKNETPAPYDHYQVDHHPV